MDFVIWIGRSDFKSVGGAYVLLSSQDESFHTVHILF